MQHLANLLAASLRLQRPTDQNRDNFGQALSGRQTKTECKHCSWDARSGQKHLAMCAEAAARLLSVGLAYNG